MIIIIKGEKGELQQEINNNDDNNKGGKRVSFSKRLIMIATVPKYSVDRVEFRLNRFQTQKVLICWCTFGLAV